MTRNEMKEHLDPNKFEPFRITMNSGEQLDIQHPENARLSITDALYVFKPTSEPGADAVTICRIHNICTIEKPIGSAHAAKRTNGSAAG